MAAATTKMAALNSATSSNAIDPNAEDNCDDAETGFRRLNYLPGHHNQASAEAVT